MFTKRKAFILRLLTQKAEGRWSIGAASASPLMAWGKEMLPSLGQQDQWLFSPWSSQILAKDGVVHLKQNSGCFLIGSMLDSCKKRRAETENAVKRANTSLTSCEISGKGWLHIWTTCLGLCCFHLEVITKGFLCVLKYATPIFDMLEIFNNLTRRVANGVFPLSTSSCLLTFPAQNSRDLSYEHLPSWPED